MLRTRNVIFLGMVMIAAGIFSQAGAEVVDRIVAVVNNEIITLSELNKATAMYKSKIQASQNSEARKKEMIAELKKLPFFKVEFKNDKIIFLKFEPSKAWDEKSLQYIKKTKAGFIASN